jgi:hypothetical protein
MGISAAVSTKKPIGSGNVTLSPVPTLFNWRKVSFQ